MGPGGTSTEPVSLPGYWEGEQTLVRDSRLFTRSQRESLTLVLQGPRAHHMSLENKSVTLKATWGWDSQHLT